jgi:hypothetical protein
MQINSLCLDNATICAHKKNYSLLGVVVEVLLQGKIFLRYPSSPIFLLPIKTRGHSGHDCMVVGFTTAYVSDH